MRVRISYEIASCIALLAAQSVFAGQPIPRELEASGYRVRLDLSRQVLQLSVPVPPPLYSDKAGKVEEEIHATLGGLADVRMVSAAALAQKAKAFDDGLYAAVELAAETGVGRFAGKKMLLDALARGLASADPRTVGNAVDVLLGASRLGGVVFEPPEVLKPRVDKAVADFLKDELNSKPISFYTWSPELQSIFRQDRMLQQPLTSPASVRAVVQVLARDAKLRASYEDYLTLVSKLTNPLSQPDLRPFLADPSLAVLEKAYFFFPPSIAHETELVKRLFPGGRIPEGFNLADEMIRRIRSGALKLEPTAASGWYDHQTWALEPLVVPERMPEAKRLDLSESYRKQLLELFKGVQAMTRETHIKQLEIPRVTTAAAPFRPPKEPVHIRIEPELSAEPLATAYLRRALAYRFVRTAVEGAFGPGALAKMKRITPVGPVAIDLGQELGAMEGLFNGAFETISRELGMAAPKPDGDAARFVAWAKNVASDADVGRDVRMMVPLFYDEDRQKTKVWVVLGWVGRAVDIGFATPPLAEILGPSGQSPASGEVVLDFVSERRKLAYPVTAEVYVSDILNREEFRHLCDTYKTQAAILAHLR